MMLEMSDHCKQRSEADFWPAIVCNGANLLLSQIVMKVATPVAADTSRDEYHNRDGFLSSLNHFLDSST